MHITKKWVPVVSTLFAIGVVSFSWDVISFIWSNYFSGAQEKYMFEQVGEARSKLGPEISTVQSRIKETPYWLEIRDLSEKMEKQEIDVSEFIEKKRNIILSFLESDSDSRNRIIDVLSALDHYVCCLEIYCEEESFSNYFGKSICLLNVDYRLWIESNRTTNKFFLSKFTEYVDGKDCGKLTGEPALSNIREIDSTF